MSNNFQHDPHFTVNRRHFDGYVSDAMKPAFFQTETPLTPLLRTLGVPVLATENIIANIHLHKKITSFAACEV